MRKKAPTKEEKEWMASIVRLGCVVCRLRGLGESPADCHHLLSGGRRMGHLFTIPLCAIHHRRGSKGHISRDQCLRRFEAEYGTEQQLLERTRELVREQRAMAV